MANDKLVEKRARVDLVADEIDRICDDVGNLFTEGGGMKQELLMARTMADMRAMLTEEVMEPILALMNTDLGFRTDRDPNRKDKDGKYPEPYRFEVVKECFIESRLRGFHSVGNEWNIIAGRFYGCKAGLERKVRKHPKMAEFKDSFSVPMPGKDGNAIVKASATWVFDGKPDQIEREIPIRVNAYMGDDAISGKAQRKLYKAVWDRISGTNTPEGEVEANEREARTRQSKLVPPTPEVKPLPKIKAGEDQGDLLG